MFAPRAIDGLVVGYVMAPSAPIFVASIWSSRSKISRKANPTIHRVKEVIVPKGPVSFPAAATPALSPSASHNSFVVPSEELFEQGGAGSRGGDALDPESNSIFFGR